MKSEYNLASMKSRPNPYASKPDQSLSARLRDAAPQSADHLAKPLKSYPSKERCSGLSSLSGLEIPNDAHLKFDTHR